MNINKLSSKIIGAAIEVHKALGPGLLEFQCARYERRHSANCKQIRGIISRMGLFAFRRPCPAVFCGVSEKQKKITLCDLCLPRRSGRSYWGVFAVNYYKL